MTKFKKKPVIVDAIQWFGDVSDLKNLGTFDNVVSQDLGSSDLEIESLDGTSPLIARTGVWIIRNDRGELRLCNSSIFDELYDPVEAMTKDDTA